MSWSEFHRAHWGAIMQVARNLLDAEDGFLLGKTHIILDRDPLYTKQFRAFLKNAGVKPIRLPPRSPNECPCRAVCFVSTK